MEYFVLRANLNFKFLLGEFIGKLRLEDTTGCQGHRMERTFGAHLAQHPCSVCSLQPPAQSSISYELAQGFVL